VILINQYTEKKDTVTRRVIIIN